MKLMVGLMANPHPGIDVAPVANCMTWCGLVSPLTSTYPDDFLEYG